MDRDEILADFYIAQIPNGIRKLKELDEFCWNNRDKFKKELQLVFTRLSEHIALAQSEKRKGDLFCISLCFFRSKFIMREGTIRIYGLDRRFFLDPDPLWEEMDLSSLCSFLWELEDGMCGALTKYKNKLKERDVQTIIQTKYVPLLIGYITELVRYAVRNGCAECMDGMMVTDDFSIMAGEHQGNFEQVYVTEALDTGGKSLKEFLYRFREDELALSCKRYINETLENMDLGKMNFTKSHFHQMNFFKFYGIIFM